MTAPPGATSVTCVANSLGTRRGTQNLELGAAASNSEDHWEHKMLGKSHENWENLMKIDEHIDEFTILDM